MYFFYSNNFHFKNDVAANVIITKKEEKYFLGHFPHFWSRGTENRTNTGRSINQNQVEI